MSDKKSGNSAKELKWNLNAPPFSPNQDQIIDEIASTYSSESDTETHDNCAVDVFNTSQVVTEQEQKWRVTDDSGQNMQNSYQTPIQENQMQLDQMQPSSSGGYSYGYQITPPELMYRPQVPAPSYPQFSPPNYLMHQIPSVPIMPIRLPYINPVVNEYQARIDECQRRIQHQQQIIHEQNILLSQRSTSKQSSERVDPLKDRHFVARTPDNQLVEIKLYPHPEKNPKHPKRPNDSISGKRYYAPRKTNEYLQNKENIRQVFDPIQETSVLVQEKTINFENVENSSLRNEKCVSKKGFDPTKEILKNELSDGGKPNEKAIESQAQSKFEHDAIMENNPETTKDVVDAKKAMIVEASVAQEETEEETEEERQEFQRQLQIIKIMEEYEKKQKEAAKWKVVTKGAPQQVLDKKTLLKMGTLSINETQKTEARKKSEKTDAGKDEETFESKVENEPCTSSASAESRKSSKKDKWVLSKKDKMKQEETDNQLLENAVNLKKKEFIQKFDEEFKIKKDEIIFDYITSKDITSSGRLEILQSIFNFSTHDRLKEISLNSRFSINELKAQVSKSLHLIDVVMFVRSQITAFPDSDYEYYTLSMSICDPEKNPSLASYKKQLEEDVKKYSLKFKFDLFAKWRIVQFHLTSKLESLKEKTDENSVKLFNVINITAKEIDWLIHAYIVVVQALKMEYLAMEEEKKIRKAER